MDIVITAIHSELSATVKDYARDKIGRLEKYFDKARKTDVTIHAEHGNNAVELICHGARGHVFTVHVTAEESVREAIDLAVDKMATQLRRHKEKVHSHKGKDNRKKLVRDIQKITQRLSALEVEALDPGSADAEDDDEGDEQ